ncbi:unnamed protein product [Ectocarpus sp. 12 AP-2014]
MALLPSTPSTPPLITNHSSHRQSSFHPINTIHPCLAKAAKPPAPLPTHRPPPLDPLRRLLLRLLLPRRPRTEPAHLRVLALICRIARASPGRPRAAIPLSTHRLQYQPLLKGKYPQRQGLLPRLQELERRHLRVDWPVDQVPWKGLLALRL